MFKNFIADFYADSAFNVTCKTLLLILLFPWETYFFLLKKTLVLSSLYSHLAFIRFLLKNMGDEGGLTT